ncbi:MAG: hypothetical protein HOC79_07950 [Euryarchaeota archaeon]|jgi:hypothetical protein|nr:hypothetical protein [Euryarchaeota archaeon]
MEDFDLSIVLALASGLIVALWTKNELTESPLIFLTGITGGSIGGYIVGGIIGRWME